jgi:hypothetical protein
MDPIRKALEEVYGERQFSNQKKQETLKAVRRVKGRKRTFAAAIVMTIMAVILVVSLVQPSNQYVSISTEKAPETVEEAYMERFAAAMVTDDEKAVMAYLSESDWLLQRAIESGESAFYQSPELTADERRNLSALLYYMYLWRLEVKGAKPPIPNVTSFDELRMQSASFVEAYERFFPDKRYTSSSQEQTWLSTTYFGSMSKYNKTVLLCVIIGFGALFILNFRMKSNRFFKAIPLFILLICVVPFVMPASEKYVYDETSMMTAVLDEEEIEGARLTDAAAFGNHWYALITTEEGVNYFAHFLKNENGYVLWDTKWGKEDFMMGSQSQWGRQIIAVHDGHEINRIDMVGDYESEGTVIPIEVEEGAPAIRAIVKPENFKSFHYEYYDGKGEKID